MTLVSNVGGASGPLYGTFFLRLRHGLRPRDAISVDDLVKAFRAGVEGLVARGKPELGDKTMYDSLHPALEALDAAAGDGRSAGDAFTRGVASRRRAAATPRSRWWPARVGPAISASAAPATRIPAQRPQRCCSRPPPAPSRSEGCAMVGIVVVSHSRRLADAAVELALQMVRGTPPPIEIAAGLDGHVLGTDAARVKEAIDRVASPDGVLVIMDLGSAVLSAELALELRGDDRRLPRSCSPMRPRRRPRRRRHAGCCGSPVGRGRGRRRPGRTDQDQAVGRGEPPPGSPAHGAEPHTAVASIELAIHNEHGLHARPAARFVETVRRFDADVTVRNLTQRRSDGQRPQRQRAVDARRARRPSHPRRRLRPPSP